jgi:hypothetical protein
VVIGFCISLLRKDGEVQKVWGEGQALIAGRRERVSPIGQLRNPGLGGFKAKLW